MDCTTSILGILLQLKSKCMVMTLISGQSPNSKSMLNTYVICLLKLCVQALAL